MEPKKNPKIELNNKRGMIFNLSLVLSFVVVITAFRWNVPIPETRIDVKPTEIDDGIIYVSPTEHPVADRPKPAVTVKPIVANPNFIGVDVLPKETDSPMIDAPVDVPAITITIPQDPGVDSAKIEWKHVEKMPEPVGGYKQFYQEMKENLKYPRRAVATGTEGKVFVEFTIEPTGQLSNIRAIKGISEECDKEAVRVIGLSKWNPGKQRAKPVRVRMVLPVHFQIGKQ